MIGSMSAAMVRREKVIFLQDKILRAMVKRERKIVGAKNLIPGKLLISHSRRNSMYMQYLDLEESVHEA